MPEKIQRSFTSGEIAPSLQSRADIVKYSTGLNLCQNNIIRAQGGSYSRPGFRYIGELDDSTKVGRLIPFSFNTEQNYVLVYEDLKTRVIKDGGYVLKAEATITGVTQASPAVVTAANTFANGESVYIDNIVGMTELNGNTYTVANATATDFELSGIDSTAYTAYTSGGTAQSDGLFELTTPYTEAQLPRLGYTQNADVMTIAHPSHDPSNINRLDHDDWTITAIDYASQVTAPVISSVVQGGGPAGSWGKLYKYVVTAVDENGVESLASAGFGLATAWALTATVYNLITWGAVTGADYYRIYKDPSYNTDVYGWIGDSNSLTFYDYNIAPITSDAPPEDRQPFTDADDKPSVVGYFQQRQIFANTNNEPQAVYTTQTDIYDSLRTADPAHDDDAVTFTIAAQQVNEIRHLVSVGSLMLLTSGGEWKVTEGQDEVLTPSTIGARPQSFNGSSWVKPVVINSTVLYLQAKGNRIRDLGYEFSSDKYTGNNLSLMAEHLFHDHTIIDMAYADSPDGVLWCVRDDGVLLGLTYQREHQVWGWHQHITDGEFESVTVIEEDGRDALYVIVKRTINSVTKRYIERLEPREKENAEDAFCVDSGLTYSGIATTTITGLDHLEGEDVAVLADGNVVTGKTVSSGSITLDIEATKVHVGLPYTPAIELLDIDVASTTDTVKSKSVSVSKVTIEVEDSRGGFVGARQDATSVQSATFQEIKPRFDSDSYDPIELKTYKMEVFIDPMWSKGGGIRIEQRAPLPLNILSVIPRIDVGGS